MPQHTIPLHNVSVTFETGLKLHYKGNLGRSAVSMYSYAITAKCKYDKNRCLRAEVLCGHAMKLSGLQGSYLWNLLPQMILFPLACAPASWWEQRSPSHQPNMDKHLHKANYTLTPALTLCFHSHKLHIFLFESFKMFMQLMHTKSLSPHLFKFVKLWLEDASLALYLNVSPPHLSA